MYMYAGLAFCGTGLCSYRVRGVDGSCAKHLTVESYTVIMLLTVLLIISIPSPPHSSFSANSSHRSLPFFLRTDFVDSFFAVTSEHICFFSVLHFLVVVSMR